MGEVVEPLRDRICGRSLSHWGLSIEGDVHIYCTFSSFPETPALLGCLNIALKQCGQSVMGWSLQTPFLSLLASSILS